MNEHKRIDIAVVGGGIVGCATAMALTSNPSVSVAIIEREDGLARHQTGNNSGVIHSGLYYRPGSLKAVNCTKGREALYRFCEASGIAHEKCGKIVVATRKEELGLLNVLEQRGRANGLTGLTRIGTDEIKEVEPNIRGIAGLRVPEAGIVDYISVTRAYGKAVERAGGEIHLVPSS